MIAFLTVGFGVVVLIEVAIINELLEIHRELMKSDSNEGQKRDEPRHQELH